MGTLKEGINQPHLLLTLVGEGTWMQRLSRLK